MNLYQIIKRPLITEKSTIMQEKENKYAFMVDRRANKHQIKNAVEKLFNVDVEGIATMNVSGKLRRMGRYAGHRPDWKKAIVQITKGQKIKIIEESK